MKRTNHTSSRKSVIYGKRNLVPIMTIKNTTKSKITDITLVNIRVPAHNVCNLRYKTPKDIPVVFHNGSRYDYDFTIKELAEESEGQFECLGEKTEKYITFSIPIEK